GDLGGVERGALPQVVAGHEELQRPRIVQRAAHPPHPHRIGTHRVDRHRELPGARVVDHEHAGRLLQQVPGRLYLYLTVEDRVYRDRVAGDHGHAYAGGGDLEIRQAEDLARLVAQLHLLRGPTVVAQRPGPGDHIQHDRRRERAGVLAQRLPHVTGALPDRPVTRHLGELVVQHVHPVLAGAGDRLVGGEDQLSQPVLTV